MKTLILCGGRGTRAYPHTAEIPKPLLDVGGRPVLQHVLDIYAAQGFSQFVLAVGYLGDRIAAWADSLTDGYEIEVVDTGIDAGTGERILRCREHLDGTFLATYADGLGNVDLGALRRFHDGHPGTATLTTVPLPSPYGTVVSGRDGLVERFREKPVLADHRINAGFFAFDVGVFDAWVGADLEREVLPALAARGLLFAFPHDGFWRSLDTYKDAVELGALVSEGGRPWLAGPDGAGRALG